MANVRDRILIVESDPEISELVGRQALQAAGYQTFIVADVNTAISKAIQLAPDVIIADLNLPGLSGKDLLVALNSQGIETPVIILASHGMEADIIQTFRLGASDYLLWPLRETEVINAVERLLKQVHERRERERLARQLRQTNQELQQRVRELTSIFAVGKAVTSITDPNMLYDKILEGAIKVSQADMGWFLLRDEVTKNFHLMALSNLPPSMNLRQFQVWDDGISSLVAMSGEPLSIHGDPLKRFKISMLGQSALIVPVRSQKSVIGLLVVMRKQPAPFSDAEQHLLEAVADYASISLVNARLFRTIEERARSQQTLAESALAGEKITNNMLLLVKSELSTPLESARQALERLVKDPTAHWKTDQRRDLTALHEELAYLARIADAIAPLPMPQSTQAGLPSLTDVARQAVARFLPFAQQNHLTLTANLPAEALPVRADPIQVGQVLDGLLSYALRASNPGGQVTVALEKAPEGWSHLSVRDSSPGMDPSRLAHIFENGHTPDSSSPRRFGGLGISLGLAFELVGRQNGKLWAESKTGQGTTFHVTFPAAR